jgi:uncharacterized membrane protein
MDGRLASGAPTRWVRGIALACHVALAIALAVLAKFPGWLLALPLLLPLPGLWRGKAYTYAWCSMLIVFYAGGFLMEAWANPETSRMAIPLAIVAAVEFCALVLYVRFAAVDARRASA